MLVKYQGGTDIQNGNIVKEPKNNMFMGTYVALRASDFGAAGNNGMKKSIFKLSCTLVK
jgi:hypothetical protein